MNNSTGWSRRSRSCPGFWGTVWHCKDIPDQPVLDFIAAQGGKWCTWNGDGSVMPNVAVAMPEGVPAKVVLAKMRRLIKRGLVEGCICGCRGDFHLPTVRRMVIAALQC